MSPMWMRWGPAALLTAGVALMIGVDAQHRMPLRTPLPMAVPVVLAGYTGTDQEVSAEEQQVAGMTSYVLRSFTPAEMSAAAGAFSVYVGYYESQMQGRTIHSPRNCLPGGGWEALASRKEWIPTPLGAVPVNHYLLEREGQRALVLYWYQGRGRIEADEYRVKWDLLRDAALRRRSDEALVRIVVPVTTGEQEAFALASSVARELIPAVDTALPT